MEEKRRQSFRVGYRQKRVGERGGGGNVFHYIFCAEIFLRGRWVEVGQRKTIEIISKLLFWWCEERKK